MNTITALPDATHVIGLRSVLRAMKASKIKHVIVAKNCPAALLAKFESVALSQFQGDQKEMGTKLGKPFPVAIVGYHEALEHQ